MTLTFELDPQIDGVLRDAMTELWTDVSNAGGAVGFVPPVTADDIRPALARHLDAAAEGCTRPLVGRDEDGTVAAMALLALNTDRVAGHWLWLYAVMVHPRHHGKGYGRALMDAAAEAARGIEDIEAIRLTCRGGTGLDRFYALCGYKEVGRVPDAVRVAAGDDRDEVIMLLPLG